MRVTNRATLMLSAGVALALAACSPSSQTDRQTLASGNEFFPGQPADTLPMSNQATPLRVASSALPQVRPISYDDWGDAPDSYGYIDQADDLFDLIGDAPPDYGFDYDNADYWAWQFGDGYATYVEPIDDGYRYYYYEPGSVTPFFVSDPRYSYAYRGGRVAAVYAGGRLVQPSFAQGQAAQAAAYYARGRSLRSTAATPSNRRSVPAPVWATRRASVIAPRAQWNAARQREPEWRTYRTREEASGRNRDLAVERTARVEAGQRFNAWQHQGFQGSAPQLYASAARGAPAVAAQGVSVRQNSAAVAPAALQQEARRAARPQEFGPTAAQPAAPGVAANRIATGQPRTRTEQFREQRHEQTRTTTEPSFAMRRQPAIPQPAMNAAPQMQVRQRPAEQPHFAPVQQQHFAPATQQHFAPAPQQHVAPAPQPQRAAPTAPAPHPQGNPGNHKDHDH